MVMGMNTQLPKQLPVLFTGACHAVKAEPARNVALPHGSVRQQSQDPASLHPLCLAKAAENVLLNESACTALCKPGRSPSSDGPPGSGPQEQVRLSCQPVPLSGLAPLSVLRASRLPEGFHSAPQESSLQASL